MRKLLPAFLWAKRHAKPAQEAPKAEIDTSWLVQSADGRATEGPFGSFPLNESPDPRQLSHDPKKGPR